MSLTAEKLSEDHKQFTVEVREVKMPVKSLKFKEVGGTAVNGASIQNFTKRNQFPFMQVSSTFSYLKRYREFIYTEVLLKFSNM